MWVRKKNLVHKFWERKKLCQKKIGYVKIGYDKKLGTKTFLQQNKNWVRKKIRYETILVRTKIGVRGRSSPGELDPKSSHIFQSRPCQTQSVKVK